MGIKASSDHDMGILLESGTNEVEFLEFTVCEHRFGVNVAKISQALVLKDLHLTELPSRADWLLGTVYFRGVPISVIDLKNLLALSGESAEPDKQLLLVMEFNNKVNGFVIDGVEAIRRVTWKDFVALEDSVSGKMESSVIGTVTLDDRIVMILDVEAMMATVDPSMNIEYYVDAISQIESIDRSQLSIVYAEDSSVVQKVTVKILEDAGFANFHLFPTGGKALDFVRKAGPGKVDVILSDIEMPEMDGLTFCRNVKSDPQFANIPFIFYSSLINEQMRRKCDSVGGDRSLSKPEIHLIVGAIEELYLRSKQA